MVIQLSFPLTRHVRSATLPWVQLVRGKHNLKTIMLKKSYNKLLNLSLNPATLLRLHYSMTWGERGAKHKKSDTRFTGFDGAITCDTLGISYGNNTFTADLQAAREYIEVEKEFKNGRQHTVLILNKSSLKSSFLYPEGLLHKRTGLTPSQRSAMLMAFSYRDKHSFQLRSDKDFLRAICRCVCHKGRNITLRAARRIKSDLIELKFLQESIIDGIRVHAILNHESYKEKSWHKLVVKPYINVNALSQ